MGILNLKVLFLFIFPVIYASNDCRFSLCGNNSILIRFPFQLEGEQPPYCGYPGFNLFCTNDSKTVLKLPYSGKFHVRNINYLTQEIQVYDPGYCLPKRLLSHNFSGSPFTATYNRDYTFISCPNQSAGLPFIPIDCLSNSSNFVFAIPSVNLAHSSLESCYVIKRLSIPVSRRRRYEDNLRYDLNEDLLLTWDIPSCGYCESQELLCGLASPSSNLVVCLSNGHTGSSQNGLRIFRVMALCIAAPAVIFAILMASCVCYKDRIAPRRNAVAATTDHEISQPAEAAEAVMGLDESTIESYEKVVIGESRRVPGPNNGCCWICLAEYNSKETVRCIPECKHCFHAECIDEWLRINITCPVCRNSPSPSPLHAATSTNP